MRHEELFAFMKERHIIYVLREQGFKKPWTLDPILQNYRFCNVYRELDKETIWFAKNWREPYADEPDLWFASLVFRFINRSDTATELGYPVPWSPSHFKRTLQARKNRGDKVYSGAYMISTHGVREPKHSYLAKSLTKIYAERDYIRWRGREDTLGAFHSRLMEQFDVGAFVAAQVVADIKYIKSIYYFVRDWDSFAASGPGSRRGMNRVLGIPHIRQPMKEEKWKEHLTNLKGHIDPMVEKAGMPRIHAQDLQNCLCEFDKYERVRLGEGFPKQRYNGREE